MTSKRRHPVELVSRFLRAFAVVCSVALVCGPILEFGVADPSTTSLQPSTTGWSKISTKAHKSPVPTWAVLTGTAASTTIRGLSLAAEGGGFTALPKVLDDAGNLTNGTYTVNDAAMAAHMPSTALPGKGVFLSSVDAHSAVLDAAQYADENGLWVGAKAKVPVVNGPVGVLGNSGLLTDWINVYRRASGFIHGSPGTPGD